MRHRRGGPVRWRRRGRATWVCARPGATRRARRARRWSACPDRAPTLHLWCRPPHRRRPPLVPSRRAAARPAGRVCGDDWRWPAQRQAWGAPRCRARCGQRPPPAAAGRCVAWCVAPPTPPHRPRRSNGATARARPPSWAERRRRGRGEHEANPSGRWPTRPTRPARRAAPPTRPSQWEPTARPATTGRALRATPPNRPRVDRATGRARACRHAHGRAGRRGRDSRTACRAP